ncbi:MAG: DUF547 domain-containing protein [Bacteroidia bacterium]|nr:DUF547 domain-containing protein [Bacteroidia bacterium]
MMNKKSLPWILAITILVALGAYLSTANVHALGVRILSAYKFMKGEKIVYKDLLAENSKKPSHDDWDGMLKLYVQENGDVDYKGWLEDSLRLNAYLEKISSNPPGTSWTKADQLAYWINAYNAFTIKIVLDHYPVKSIKDIGGDYPFINSVWDLKFFKIASIDMDLNTIEHRILRREFDDPRIHFAINCASFSCPKLRNEAYTTEKLELQLMDQAKYFIHNETKNRIGEREVLLSMIFKWYEDDFVKELPIKDYINQYLETKIAPDTKLGFMNYNWNLNEVSSF